MKDNRKRAPDLARLKGNMMKRILYSAFIAVTIAAPATADVVSICNDTMDTCLVHKTQSFGSFENPIQDNYPDQYPPGYLHDCAGGCCRGVVAVVPAGN